MLVLEAKDPVKRSRGACPSDIAYGVAGQCAKPDQPTRLLTGTEPGGLQPATAGLGNGRDPRNMSTDPLVHRGRIVVIRSHEELR